MSMPAITDAELTRLLGAGSAVPAMPTGLADRIMAALPAPASTPRPARPAAALPPAQPRRRTVGRRWMRAGLATVAGLGLATAVAAGLARTPLFAPVLAPVMDRLASVTGLPVLAPPRAAPTLPAVAPVSPRPAAPMAAPTAPPRIEATLPPPVAPDLPLPVPPMPEAARRAPAAAIAAMRQDRAAAVLNPAQLDRPASLDRPGLLDRPALADRLPERLPPGLPERASDRLSERLPGRDAPAAMPPTSTTDATLPAAAEPSLVAEVVADASDGPGSVRSEKAADIAAEIAELREARKSGQLTAAQAQRLRALQQLRALRAARAPREALRQRR